MLDLFTGPVGKAEMEAYAAREVLESLEESEGEKENPRKPRRQKKRKAKDPVRRRQRIAGGGVTA